MIGREELERLHEAATPGPWIADEYEIVHPDGPQAWSKNEIANVAVMVYLRNVVPDILELLTERDTLAAENAALAGKVEGLKEVLEPFAQLNRRKANFVIRPNDPIVRKAARALES